MQAQAPSITLTNRVSPLRARLRVCRAAWPRRTRKAYAGFVNRRRRQWLRCSSLQGVSMRLCQTTRQSPTRTRSTEEPRLNFLSLRWLAANVLPLALQGGMDLLRP